ncbi:hypothetical protein SEPCBS57363_001778 [Sporothrix epigloea]|uniref:TLC domain-containing protein n=1 Tax=Sporothrix epigloea TaxID=1892477 RepID=A0ABP0DC78_9PEZI
MKDFFPIPPIPALSRAIQPLADYLGLEIMPLHIHQILIAALFYTVVQVAVSPLISNYFVPNIYGPMSRSKKVSWDSHVVSLVQSLLINGLALWCIATDQERKNMDSDWKERIYGYVSTSATISAFACGYFLWDLVITLLNFDAFGPGLLAHAFSALAVFSFGFQEARSDCILDLVLALLEQLTNSQQRPFLTYYGCVFILYELSTPFLNVHWFCDKLGMTGSRLQLYNGIALLTTFFSCRLIYGTYMSAWVYHDMWKAVWDGPSVDWVNNPAALNPSHVRAPSAGQGPIPLWLFLMYVASNVTLNSLNVYWFFKMIAAVRKRFEPTPGEKSTNAEKSLSNSASIASGAEINDAAARQRPIVANL